MSIYIVSTDNISYLAFMSVKFYAAFPACFHHALLVLVLLGLTLLSPAPFSATKAGAAGLEAGGAEAANQKAAKAGAGGAEAAKTKTGSAEAAKAEAGSAETGEAEAKGAETSKTGKPEAETTEAKTAKAEAGGEEAGEAGNQELPLLGFHQVRPGLELAMAQLPESRQKGSGALLVILRIDPARHDFALSMAVEAGSAHSFAGWSQRDELRAGINASMYLPDMRTSTGFMRNGALVNNGNLGARLGAFFLAGPRGPGLAGASIIDRRRPGWRALLEEYDIVVQNYRFMDENGKALWKPDGQAYSMAVVGQDGAGRILFILSQEPLGAERFAFYLCALPLDLRSVMYVEGGAQAGLFLRLEKDDPMQVKDAGASLPGASVTPVEGGTVHVWKGRRSLLNTPGKADALLPNVIGIKRAF